jgi:hypothetical protein
MSSPTGAGKSIGAVAFLSGSIFGSVAAFFPGSVELVGEGDGSATTRVVIVKKIRILKMDMEKQAPFFFNFN